MLNDRERISCVTVLLSSPSTDPTEEDTFKLRTKKQKDNTCDIASLTSKCPSLL